MKIEEKETIKKYSLSAKAYHNMRTKDNPKGWFFNEYLEMPCTLYLLGNIKGKKILDLGCGTGIYAKILSKKGAIIKGFDITKEMLEIAKIENPKLDLRLGSAYKIPFKEKFDIILASLVVHYLKDWDTIFKEVKKVLKPEGIFIFSTGNPVAETKNYFKESKISVSWKDDNGNIMRMPYYHKTYETIIKTIIKNNFEILDYKDRFPLKKAKRLFPNEYKEYSKVPFFCVWKLRKKL